MGLGGDAIFSRFGSFGGIGGEGGFGSIGGEIFSPFPIPHSPFPLSPCLLVSLSPCPLVSLVSLLPLVFL